MALKTTSCCRTRKRVKAPWSWGKSPCSMGNRGVRCNAQVYRLSIGAACGMTWPSDKLVIQVLDDSTDPAIREMVEGECGRWAGKGVSIRYENRRNRSGYKAGAMREGLRKAYARECELVAIFDADFQPDADFLLRTVPVLVADPGVALVQARWRFVNADECLLTRIQEMSLDYHFRVEQEVGSACHGFFGFNGTAGVWRVRALEEAGGWKERTTVEDMDLALVAHLLTFSFYCVVIPACVLAGSDHVRLPKYVALYVPAAITLLNAACTPRSCHLLIFWILFENVMSMHRTKATLIGLLEATRANEWVVTDKRGNANPKHQQPANTTTRPGRKTTTSSSRTSFFNNDVHVAEILLGACLLYCALYDIAYGRDSFYIYLLLQSAAAFIVGFGYVGT
ncbi:hypothetical protein OsJ_30439 [Oryza sativa Japonica Group]|uniref:glucomannan 4-beta-mannosyltransferase n=1 Tax=Oryza sativa subsp. japonica TaxID=39947 RepID=A3C1R6_ORYSJ|nr:hypothetical protein OsJ_30439 [Oryza sativa Japonica Group]